MKRSWVPRDIEVNQVGCPNLQIESFTSRAGAADHNAQLARVVLVRHGLPSRAFDAIRRDDSDPLGGNAFMNHRSLQKIKRVWSQAFLPRAAGIRFARVANIHETDEFSAMLDRFSSNLCSLQEPWIERQTTRVQARLKRQQSHLRVNRKQVNPVITIWIVQGGPGIFPQFLIRPLLALAQLKNVLNRLEVRDFQTDILGGVVQNELRHQAAQLRQERESSRAS